MNDERPSQWLTRQHRQLDEIMQQILDGTRDLTRLREGIDLLRLHLWVEEEVLFNAIASPSLAIPIYIMQYEHAQMWPLLQELATACAAGTAPARLREPCCALYRLLQAHNFKEEDLIYAAVDRMAASERSGVRIPLTAPCETSVPEGWTCRGRRANFAPPPGAPSWPPSRSTPEVARVDTMMLDSFQGLLQAAREQPEGQRLLLVFVKTSLPDGVNQAQKDRYEQGQGGALVPVMYADKELDEIADFRSLMAEAERTGQHLGKGLGHDWDMVIVGCLGGCGERAPTSMEAQLPLDEMLRVIRFGGSLTHLVGFDRDGTPIQFQ